MRRFTLPYLLFVLCSCGLRTTEPQALVISDPRLIDYKTTDDIVMKAVARSQEYLRLKEGEGNIRDFYIDSVLINVDTIELWIHHRDYYEVLEYIRKEKVKEDEAAARGDTLILIYVPPTGNWSGKDRAIRYIVKTDSLIDLLVQ